MTLHKFRICFSISMPQKDLEIGHSIHSSFSAKKLFLAESSILVMSNAGLGDDAGKIKLSSFCSCVIYLCVFVLSCC